MKITLTTIMILVLAAGAFAETQLVEDIETDAANAQSELTTDSEEDASISSSITSEKKDYTSPGLTSGEQDPFAALARLVGSMAIVLGLIVCAALMSRKLLSKMRVQGGRERLVNVRQVVGLGARKQVFVLDAGPHTLIIGSSGDSMRLLAKLPRYERTVEPAAESDEFKPPGDGDAWNAEDTIRGRQPSILRDTFAAMLKKIHPNDTNNEEGADAAS